MILGFVIGFIVGFAIPLTVAAGGARYLSKHPDMIVKAMGRKMVRELRKGRNDADASIGQ